MTNEQIVVIVDDDPAARESLAALIQSKGLNTEAYASADEFLRKMDRSRRGVVILDVRLANSNGIELLEQLSREGFALPVIIVTGFGNIPLAVRAMRAGAFSFLEKNDINTELWTTIEDALDWETKSREKGVLRQQIRERMKDLTADEHRVLDRLIAGQANKVIAAELDIGLRTVELRRANILKKLQARSLAELVRFVLLAQEDSPE